MRRVAAIAAIKINAARVCVALVTGWNLQAAFTFIVNPGKFAHAYELSGIPGEAAIRGFGILFLMWNIPYLFAAKDPARYKLALNIALLSQLIGFIGESYIFHTLTLEHIPLRNSILRFILFDSAGVFLLAISWMLLRDKES